MGSKGCQIYASYGKYKLVGKGVVGPKSYVNYKPYLHMGEWPSG